MIFFNIFPYFCSTDTGAVNNGTDAVLYKIAKEIYLSGKPTGVSDEFLSDLEKSGTYGKHLAGCAGKILLELIQQFLCLLTI